MRGIHLKNKQLFCDLACFSCESRHNKDCLLGNGQWPLAYYVARSFIHKEIELNAQGLWRENVMIDAGKEEIFPPTYYEETEN